MTTTCRVGGKGTVKRLSRKANVERQDAQTTIPVRSTWI